MNTNWRAMQAAGSAAMKSKQDVFPRPSEVKAKYMVGGSWRADISKKGKRRGK